MRDGAVNGAKRLTFTLLLLMVTSMKGHLHVLGSVDFPGRRAVVPLHPLPVDCQHPLTQI